VVTRSDRDAYLRQGVVFPETPAQRRERANLEEDLRSIEQRGRPLPLRLRNFRPDPDSYLATAGGPLAYMVRLRAIEDETARHDGALLATWHALAAECAQDGCDFSARWRAIAESWPFERVNDLIDRHNRWYPVESRLPMDPISGTYALVNGRDYRLEPLDAAWILRRFPGRSDRSDTC
jgi:hypothetical protein